MKKPKVVIVSLVTIFLSVVLFLWYMGFYSELKPVEKVEGGYIVMGLDVVGPYSNIGQTMKIADKQINELGIFGNKHVGVYYDSPKIDSNKCHSLVGVILEKKDIDLLKSKKMKNLRIDSIPERNSLIFELPLKNKFSYMFGPVKVYPAFAKHIKDKGYEGILSFEIYDDENHKIIYVMQYK